MQDPPQRQIYYPKDTGAYEGSSDCIYKCVAKNHEALMLQHAHNGGHETRNIRKLAEAKQAAARCTLSCVKFLVIFENTQEAGVCKHRELENGGYNCISRRAREEKAQ